MNYRIFSTIDKKFIAAWEQLWLLSPFANYTNSPAWFLSVLQTFGFKDFVIFAFYRDEKIVGVAWLIKSKKFGVPIYTQMPNDFVCGKPFLCDITDKKLMLYILDTISTLGTVYFDNVPEHEISFLRNENKQIDITPVTVNYLLPIGQYKGGLVTIKNRNILLRRIKKQAEKFTLRVCEGYSEEFFTLLYQIDKTSRKSNRGYGLFSNSLMKDFYETLAKKFDKRFITNILFFENTPIAYEIGFLVNSVYYGTQLSFVEAYKQYAPGKVIAVKILDYLAANGVQLVDFGSGDTHVKRLITENKQQLITIVISHNSAIQFYIKHINIIKTKMYSYIKKNKMLYLLYKKSSMLLSF